MRAQVLETPFPSAAPQVTARPSHCRVSGLALRKGSDAEASSLFCAAAEVPAAPAALLWIAFRSAPLWGLLSTYAPDATLRAAVRLTRSSISQKKQIDACIDTASIHQECCLHGVYTILEHINIKGI